MTSRLVLSAAVAVTVIFSAGASAQTYEVTKLVPGSAFHGVHGLGIDKAGHLYAGSVAGGNPEKTLDTERRPPGRAPSN